MKLLNFRRHDSYYQSKHQVGLQRGNRLEAEVWKEFENRQHDLRRIVANIVRAAASEEIPSPGEDDFEAPEGRLLVRIHRSRERNRRLIERKKASALNKDGCLVCEVCGFNFEAVYGERGRGFIECHHTLPVSLLECGATTKLRDLALVCANCHRMIHASRPWWTLEQARAALGHA
ncbi:HNH endonuclease [Paracoccus saliphilus]|nr:HNH endonuclease [Paracoccus saliphilus]